MRMLKNRRGAAMLEYGLLAALIALVAIVALTPLGSNIAEVFDQIADAIGDAIPG